MSRLLVTGASGFLGWNVCAQAEPGWSVCGVAHRHADAVWPGLGVVRADLVQWEAFAERLDVLCPDLILHLAAFSDTNFCERHPQLTHQLNVVVPERLARWSEAHGRVLCFVSSGQVFDGRHPPQGPHTPVSPINAYGRQKAEAERRVRAASPRAMVVRVPVMFGWGSPVRSSFFSQWVRRLRAGQVVPAFVDEVRSFLSGRAAAQGLWVLMRHALERPEEVCGRTFHLGGKEAVSRYAFAMRVCEVFGLPKARVQPCRQAEVPMAAARPPHIAFDSSAACALGFAPWSLHRELEWLCRCASSDDQNQLSR